MFNTYKYYVIKLFLPIYMYIDHIIIYQNCFTQMKVEGLALLEIES